MPQPPGQSWRWEDYETGESGVMPWSQERDPTDYEIDSYRSREKWDQENTGLYNYARSWIPDPIENTWNYLNEPTSTAPSRTVGSMYEASGGEPVSMPFMGYNVPIPESVGRFMGSMADDQTSLLNIGLNAGTLGGYGLARAGAGTALGRLASMGQVGAGGVGMGAGAANFIDAETPSDYGTAALQMGMGAFGVWGGKGDYDAFTGGRITPPKPDVEPGPITDPTRLLGTGARFEAGPGGIGDLSDPNYTRGAAGVEPPPPPAAVPASGIEIAGLGGPDIVGEMPTMADPMAPPADLPLQPPVNPRGATNLQPFEQDASIWQRMQEQPTGEPTDLGGYQLEDPVVPNTMLEGPGTSRPASDFWRTVVAEGAPEPTINPVSAKGVPDVARPIARNVVGQNAARAQAMQEAAPFLYDLEDWKAEQVEMGSSIDEVDEAIRQSTELGIDPTKSDDLYDLENYMGAGDDPDWIPEQEALGHWSNQELIDWNKQQYGGGVSPEQEATLTAMAAEAAPVAPPVQAPAPPPVAPTVQQRAAARVPVQPTPPLRPGTPKGATPDRVLRIGRGAHDVVRVVFPDKLHADLFSAFGRMKKQMKGKGGIAPDFEGLAKRMNLTVKEVSRISSEYRNKVMAMTKALPERAPEGRDTLDLEAPHWGGKPAEMVPTPPPAPIEAAAPAPAPAPRTAKEAEWAAIRAERQATIDAAIEAEAKMKAMGESRPSTPKELADMEARHKRTQDAYAEEERLAAIADKKAKAATALNEALEARGAAPEAPVEAPKPALPKTKKARVAAVMDELGALPEDDVRALVNDPARLRATAKAAGIKSGTLKAAIQDLYEVKGTTEAGPPSESSDMAPAEVKIVRDKLGPRQEVMSRAKFDELIEAGWTTRQATLHQAWQNAKGVPKDPNVRVVQLTGSMKEPRVFVPPPPSSKVQAFFKEIAGSEKGQAALPTKQQLVKGAEKVFDVMNSVRMTSMLSGLALPKSLAGNLGAHFAAALEGKTLRPLKVLGNVKQIARDMQSGWQRGANPALLDNLGKYNLPGRAMGAADFAATQSLMRAGLTEAAAKELLLTGQNSVSAWKPLQTRAGKLLVPFRTTPFNQLGQGITRWKKHPDVYAAAAIVGVLAGTKVKEPEELAMLSAFAGPYAIPFLIGAHIYAGKEVLANISPIPEWGITKTITNPFAAFTESPGRRWFRPGAGFGEEAKKQKQRESLERRRAKRRAAAEAN